MTTPDHDPRTALVADRLARRADTVDLGRPSVDVVVRRGRQRQRRRQATLGAAAVVTVAAGSVLAIGALSRPTSTDTITGGPTATDVDGTPTSTVGSTTAVPPAPTVADPVVPAELAASPFVWNRVDPDAAEAVAMMWGGGDEPLAGDGPFVAWSTAPGRTDSYSPHLWRSDDGVSWEQVALGSDLSSRNVGERDGVFFSYGTAPATAGSGRRSDLALATSADGGRTWRTETVPLDTSDLAAEDGVTSVGVVATSMAVSAAGVLVSAQVTPVIDIASLLPDDVISRYWEVRSEGVVVVDDACAATPTTISFGGDAPASTVGDATTVPAADAGPGCDGTTYSWADLGVSARAAEAMMHPEARFFLATDGSTFEPIPVPDDLGGFWSGARLTSLGDGFAALVGSDDGTSRLWSSADGRTWTDRGAAPVSYVESLAESDGRLIATGWANGFARPTVAVFDDAGWHETDLRTLVRPDDGRLVQINASHVTAGPNGVSAIGWLYVDPVAEVGGVTFDLDGGLRVHVDDTSGTHRVFDAGGAELATVSLGVSSDPARATAIADESLFEVRTEPGGPVVATYSFDDVYTAASSGVAPPEISILFLHSTDGVTWSRESLDDLAGAKVSSSGGIRVSGNQVLVAANLADEPNPDGSPKQVVLIATPTT